MTELLVDLEAIRRNTAAVAAMLAGQGVALVAVTKGCLGEPAVAEAMLAGGAVALADTRDASLRRLRTAFPAVELHRIYLPPLRGLFEAGDVTYVSSVAAVEAVAARVGGLPGAGRGGGGSGAVASAGDGPTKGSRPAAGATAQQVMVVVETGDRREGVPTERLDEVVAAVLADSRLAFAGLATNYACFQGGVTGIRQSAGAVCAAAERLRSRGIEVPRISGGNSSLLALVGAGESLPAGVTELRCGEALLLGQDALVFEPLPGCGQDACRLRAPVLEGYTKAAPEWSGRRLVVGIGHQDLGAGSVRFALPGLHDLGRSSDYLVVGVQEGGFELSPGDVVEMVPSYRALVAAWTSPFVEVVFD